MKLYRKTIVASFLFLSMMIYGLQVMALDADDAPVSVSLDSMKELYQGVIFDHEMHVEMYGCSACHHHTTGDGSSNESCNRCHGTSVAQEEVSCSGCHEDSGGAVTVAKDNRDQALYHIDKPGLKGALHLQCLGCHQVESGPTGCEDCHAFTAAGRKRFLIKE